MMRLQQYIARCGVTSRRKAEELMTQGRVTVNGKHIRELGFKVDEAKDAVKVDGKLLRKETPVYIIMHKPEGCVCTVADEKERRTVLDLLPVHVVDKGRLFPVGRLDYNTTGCLFLTNDGDWANRITHPKYKVDKVYMVKLKGRADTKQLDRLKRGVTVDGVYVKAKEAAPIHKNEQNDVLRMVITQGLNHQVKNMCAAVGLSVVRLKRESVGKVSVAGLKPGEFRYLTREEIDSFAPLKKEVKPREKKKRP